MAVPFSAKRAQSLRLRVFGLCCDEDGYVEVGFFPECEEILTGRLGLAVSRCTTQSRARSLCGRDREPSGILLGDQDSFLAKEIQVGVTAGTRIDDGGKVRRE